MKNILLISMAALALLGCAGNIQKEDTPAVSRADYLHSLDSASVSQSLIYWTSDTAFKTNTELMLLLDTLYQHVRSDSFPLEVRAEEKWMSSYRSRLCAYFDSHWSASDTMSVYSKADSVLNEGVKLLELDCKWTTWEMMVNNGSEFTFDRCREYGLLSQVLALCDSEESKILVYHEWTLYEQMLKKMLPIVSNLVDLDCWGGSAAGPLRTYSALKLLQPRREMYRTICLLLRGDGGNVTGVYLENAEQLLLDCVSKSIDRLMSDAVADEYDKIYDEDNWKEFLGTVNATKTLAKELRPLTDEWVAAVGKLDGSLMADDGPHSVERAAAFMLMQWASVVSE